MKTNLVKIIAIAIISLVGLTILNSAPTFAAEEDTSGGDTSSTDVCSSNANEIVKESAGCNGGGDDLPEVITEIVKVVIGICGLIAVIFIIVGGVQYMTSSGDSAKTKQAKNTILYALIGLVVCALAFVIVNWVILGVLKQGGNKEKTSIFDNSAIAFLEKKL